MARETDPTASDRDPLWYKDAIIYQLHVKAFMDSDGDGIGDFKGLSGFYTSGVIEGAYHYGIFPEGN